MNRKVIKGGITVLGVFILIAFGIAFYMYNKPHQNIAKSDAEYIVTAIQLYQDFTRNEAEANQKYLSAAKGKVIQVSGKVGEINRDQQGGITLVLKDSVMGDGGISCSVGSADLGNAQMIKQGDKIVLKGECTGYLDITGEVTLTKCVFIE